MWDVDHKEGWTPKNWWFWTVVLEKTLESHLDCKEIKPVNPKGNQSWTFIRRTDAETEAPILWLPHAKSWLTGRDLDAGKDQRQEEKETIEDEIVGWHHWFNGHGFEQAPGGGEGQGSLACCSPGGQQRVRHDRATEQQRILTTESDSTATIDNTLSRVSPLGKDTKPSSKTQTLLSCLFYETL